MARDRKPKRYGRLSKSGNTSHVSRATPPEPGAGNYRPTRDYPPSGADEFTRPVQPRPARPAPPGEDDFPTAVHQGRPYRDGRYAEPHHPEPRYSEPRYSEPRYTDPRHSEPHSEPRYAEPRYPDRRDDPYYDPPPRRDPRYSDDRRYDERYRDSRYPDERYRDDRYPDDHYRNQRYPDDHYPDERYRDGRYPDERYRDDRYPDDRYPDDRRAGAAPGAPGTPPGTADPTRPVTAGGAAIVLGKAAVQGTNKAARAVTNRVITASRARGAQESGLTALIWNQVLSYGTDAMITVSLAGTVFFGASSHAQRGNVLLYLLITMAPFAVIAPVIGPALDRLQHGRRWTMAFTGIGRCILALVMAAHATDLLVLYPCALGSLVLSKAYGVVRAAAAPRLVPRGMTLTEANARLTIFGLGSTLVLGAVVGAIIKVTGSYSAGLVLTAVGFAACAFFAFRLPKQVDSAAAAPRQPKPPRSPQHTPRSARLVSWAGRGFPPHLVVAMQGQSALRLLSGMLTIYLAFYVESTSHGLTGVLQLGLVIGAAGVGNFLGTAIGTRLKMERPEMIVVIAVLVSGLVCFLAALAFSPMVASVGMLVASIGNALGKIALDALIQRDVVESQRSSAFGRSETFLQLAWVIGAALAVVLPSHHGDGPIGFCVAGGIVLAAGIVTGLRFRTASSAATRSMTSATAHDDRRPPQGPGGSVVPRNVD